MTNNQKQRPQLSKPAPRLRGTAAAVALIVLLGGCAITPHPITLQDRAVALKTDAAAMYQGQQAVSGPLTLEESMARAIKYNLDNRVKLLEEAVSQRQLDLSNFDLLPKLTVAAGYIGRDSVLASSSQDVSTGRQSLVPSTSQDKNIRTADLGFTWNILDFGVSYYQAKQQADRTMIMQEHRRKVVHTLMQQVRQAYWYALGAQQMESKIEPLLKEVQTALDDSRKIEQEKLMPPLDTLNYRRQLLDMVRQLEAVRDELAQAKARLAALMNLEPGMPFTLVLPQTLPQPTLEGNLKSMEEAALLNRPELVEARYTERIGVLETKKAMAKLLPGIEVSLMSHYDSNSFLVNNQWSDAGLRISWNLFNVLSGPKLMASAKAQEELAKMQRLAISMAVLSQVHVAYRDFIGRERQYDLATKLEQLDSDILTHTRNATRSNAEGKLAEIRAEVNALFSELRRYQSYGALQGAYGTMLTTLGADPLPDSVAAQDVNTLATTLAGVNEKINVNSLLPEGKQTLQ